MNSSELRRSFEDIGFKPVSPESLKREVAAKSGFKLKLFAIIPIFFVTGQATLSVYIENEQGTSDLLVVSKEFSIQECKSADSLLSSILREAADSLGSILSLMAAGAMTGGV